jgi:hypothetical protein
VREKDKAVSEKSIIFLNYRSISNPVPLLLDDKNYNDNTSEL